MTDLPMEGTGMDGTGSTNDMALRKQKRRRKSKTAEKGFSGWLRGPRGARAIFLAMSLAAAIYLASTYREVRAATQSFGQLRLGMTKDEVRYALGSPDADKAAGQRWDYLHDGVTLALSFDRAERLNSANCSQIEDSLRNCPEVLGLRIGSSEAAVRRRLGAPASEHFAGTDKMMRYPGLGLEFTLRRQMVDEISKSTPGTFAETLRHAMWMLLP
jgi:hypothetical protein